MPSLTRDVLLRLQSEVTPRPGGSPSAGELADPPPRAPRRPAQAPVTATAPVPAQAPATATAPVPVWAPVTATAPAPVAAPGGSAPAGHPGGPGGPLVN